MESSKSPANSSGSADSRPEAALADPTLARRYAAVETAERYRERHEQGVMARYFTRAELRLMGKVLARLPADLEVLDCPCGTGRFWPVLAPRARSLTAADVSPGMVEVAGRLAPAGLPFSIGLADARALHFPDGRFDLVFSSRLLHHLEHPDERLRVLAEFARVSRRHVVFSLFLTGNWKHRRMQRKAARGDHRASRRFFLPESTVVSECRQAGLLVRRIDHKLRFWSPLAVFTCERA